MNGTIIALTAWGMAMMLLAIAMAFVAWTKDRALNDARAQRDRLNTENAELYAQLADRNEALQEAQAEIKSLNMRTVEIEQAPAPVKRTRSKKERTA